MTERPALVVGAELRNGIRFAEGINASVASTSATLLLDDWQSEIAQELPIGLMFDTTDTPVIVDGRMVGFDRVAKIVPVP